jgi:hypothetical protein
VRSRAHCAARHLLLLHCALRACVVICEMSLTMAHPKHNPKPKPKTTTVAQEAHAAPQAQAP